MMQRSHAFVVHRVYVRAVLEQQHHQLVVVVTRIQMQRRLAGVIFRVYVSAFLKQQLHERQEPISRGKV